MQEIILPVSELKKALPGLNKIVSKKAILPVLETVQVARDAEGQLSLLATDLESFASYHLKAAQPGPALALLVPLAQLTRIVKGMKAEGTLDLLPVSKDKLKLRYAIAGLLVEQDVPTWPVDEFPRVPKVNQSAIRLEPEFGTALRQALECCSDNPARPLINGACLDVRDKQFHYVVGTNGGVLFSANCFGFDLPQSVIIPDCPFLEWTGFLDQEPGLLSVEPGQAAQPAREGQPAREARPGYVKLQTGPWTFITEEIPGKFPDWRQVLPEIGSLGTLINLSEEAVQQMLQLIPRLPGDDSPNYPLRLRVDWQHLRLEGQNKDQQEWTSISIQSVRVTGKPVAVVLNRQYLAKALRFGLKQLEVEDELCPVLFSSGGKKLVIMPINLEGTPAVAPVTPPPQSAQGETQKVAA